MFIPRGTTVHEDLSTSYILIDSLVTDLCGRSFSGFVEIGFNELDGIVLIANGAVGAVVTRTRSDQGAEYTRARVSQLADRARTERGLVAIRRYSSETAEAVAGRMRAVSLYARLSIEFTDVETMLQKLASEPDRDWFVEINTDADIAALIHVRDKSFHVIASRQGAEDEWDATESADDPARRELLSQCKRAAGTFDVYFKEPFSEATGDEIAPETLATSPDAPATSPVASVPLPEPPSSPIPQPGAGSPPAVEAISELSVVTEEFQFADNGDAPDDLTELKRLMGEIAGTIEGAAQAVDRHDGFGMCLRASQLKLAERYPFLDPFASEFEYLGGEIVFVGEATAEEFVAGLTEALTLAVDSLAESNAYGERFRAYVTEDLGKLLVRNRAELESYGLDHVIAEISRQ